MTDLGHFECSKLVYKLMLQFPRIYSVTTWVSSMKFGMRIWIIIPYGLQFTFFRNSYFWLIYAILKAQNFCINWRFSSPGFIQSLMELAQWNLVCAFVSSFPMDCNLVFVDFFTDLDILKAPTYLLFIGWEPYFW